MKIGIVGAGVVGGGVLEVLLRQGKFIRESLGLDLRVTAVADKDPAKTTFLKNSDVRVEQDAQALIGDPEIQVVVELVGGVGIAKEIVLQSIKAGKHVVTANKHLLAKFGSEIFPEAERRGVSVHFEASVGGGIPIIKTLRESLLGNEIESIQCIINGTTNYILSRMTSEGRPFEEVLSEAQKQGFAEADPSFDIDGVDASHKVAILASLAYGCYVDLAGVYTEGIRHVTIEDIRYAESLGYSVKLLGIIRRQGDRVEARVHPAMLPKSHLLANVNGVFNGVALRGDAVGSILLTGKGAGRYPTASAVVSDLIDVARNLLNGAKNRIPMGFYSQDRTIGTVPVDEIESRYYLRFTVMDSPGVLARLTAHLGKENVSIASVRQEEHSPADQVPVVILTHHAREKNVRAAVAAIDSLDVIKIPTQLIRIEEEKE